MAFGNGNGNYCVVRAYHCGAPTSGEGDALAEMRRRTALWNRYVELDHAAADAWEDALAGLAPPFAATLAIYRAARQARREAEYGQITAAKAALLAARAAYRTARTAAYQAHKAALKPIAETLEAERQAAVRATRASNDCYWANSNDVLLSYQQARQRAVKTGSHLRFQSWEWEGKLSVQWTTPPPVADVFGAANTLLQIDPGEVARAWAPDATRSEQRHLSRTTLRFRVRSATDPGHRAQPVWVTLPVVLHRSLPEGTLQAASLQRRRVGRQVRWSVVLSIRTAAPAASGNAAGVGVDLGWRTLLSAADGCPDGLRVALARDAAGETAELVLRQGWLDALERCDGLRRQRDEKADTLRDSLREQLRTWRQTAAKDQPEGTPTTPPDWFAAWTGRRAKLWHSSEALERLVWTWRFRRFAGDETLNALAETWREREIHLGEWSNQLREKLLLERRDGYRLFAKHLTERYGEIRLENLDLRPLIQAREHDAEGDPQEAGAHGEYHSIRWHRFAASVSTLVQAIESAARSRGVTVTRVDPANTTRECHVCGAVQTFDARRQISHTCTACGTEWDQDANAATNLLRREPEATATAADARGALPLGVRRHYEVGHAPVPAGKRGEGRA